MPQSPAKKELTERRARLTSLDNVGNERLRRNSLRPSQNALSLLRHMPGSHSQTAGVDGGPPSGPNRIDSREIQIKKLACNSSLHGMQNAINIKEEYLALGVRPSQTFTSY